jgi:hypothetical protein
MTHAKHAPYLPTPFMDQEQHRLLYRDKMATDEFDLECELPPIPISPDMSEEAVYQLLPTATHFEYGGFITENLIRYQKCESTFASTVESEACIWHSHPTDAPKADMPSCSDIYTFLTNRTFRAVTAAKTKIWVFDKSMRTAGTIVKLREWEEVNFMSEVRRAMQEPNGIRRYHAVAMANLGLSAANQNWFIDNWVSAVNSLGVEVRVFDRDH